MIPRTLVVIVVALLAATPAAGDNVTRKQRVDARIDTLNDKIAAARARERELAAEIGGLTQRIRSLEAEVGDVTRNLEALEQDLALQRERLARITELWQLQSQKLEFLRGQHDQAIDRLSERLVAIYQSGDPSTVDVLLQSSSFSELVTRLDYARELAGQDRRIAATVERAKVRMRVARDRTTVTRRKVRTVTQAVAARTEQVRSVRNELLARETTLAGRRADQRDRLEDVRDAKADYLHEVNSLLAVSHQLAARLQTTSGPPVQASGSGLVWPVSGPVTSGFGWRWGRMHEGIDIAVPTGTPVVAAASGRIVYAGWMGGYGNLVLIDHGGGLATAYGHNSSIAVGSGQSVSQGQVIAYAGSTGNSTGPHVHFEVRVNGSPVDPLGYLG